MKNFKDRLSDHGFEVHLCTLPLYPSDAMTASKLARGMTETGIHDFVINQRAARKYQDQTGKLTSFFHQKATGSGWESNLNKVGVQPTPHFTVQTCPHVPSTFLTPSRNTQF